MSHDVWDDESLYTLSTSLVELARQTGALAMLPVALCFGAELRLLVGELATAVSMAGQAEALARATGSPMGLYSLLVLAAWRGREPEVSRLMASVTTQMVRRGEGRWLTAVHWATAVLNNGLCRYDAALIAAERGSEYPDEMGLATWSMVELVEAAARTGQAGRAAAVLEPLSVATRASGTDWASGSRLVPRHCWKRASGPSISIKRRSNGLGVPGFASIWPAPIWSMANGCAGKTAGWTPASNCGPRTTC